MAEPFEGDWHDQEVEQFYQGLMKKFGNFKKVVDLTTGKTHAVPTYIIAKFGLKQEDLKNYPEWSEAFG